ncbi:hypothetical protein [Indiicoccus explosivorum]|uniref:hypothetical protein n=1 Tax=Indiicoccus explosivorum TaxID=1917864 RepID=UPI0019D34F82|nr:hypothetical protein [Indiicoccus explosivorum]
MKGLSDREACLYAGIAPSTLYEYCKDKPEFSERKELLKEQVKMRAKLNVANLIERRDIDLSLWYLERKAKDEFSKKQEVEHSGGIENKLDLSGLSVEELRKLANSDSEST